MRNSGLMRNHEPQIPAHWREKGPRCPQPMREAPRCQPCISGDTEPNFLVQIRHLAFLSSVISQQYKGSHCYSCDCVAQLSIKVPTWSSQVFKNLTTRRKSTVQSIWVPGVCVTPLILHLSRATYRHHSSLQHLGKTGEYDRARPLLSWSTPSPSPTPMAKSTSLMSEVGSEGREDIEESVRHESERFSGRICSTSSPRCKKAD